jgi:hypothetical protein
MMGRAERFIGGIHQGIHRGDSSGRFIGATHRGDSSGRLVGEAQDIMLQTIQG